MSDTAAATTEQLIDLSHRIRAGEEVSKEELAAAIKALRSDRYGSATAKKAKAKAKAPVDLDSLFPSTGGGESD